MLCVSPSQKNAMIQFCSGKAAQQRIPNQKTKDFVEASLPRHSFFVFNNKQPHPMRTNSFTLLLFARGKGVTPFPK
jgi:hypothetical protein